MTLEQILKDQKGQPKYSKVHYCVSCKRYFPKEHFKNEHGISVKKNNEMRKRI